MEDLTDQLEWFKAHLLKDILTLDHDIVRTRREAGVNGEYCDRRCILGRGNNYVL